MVQQEIIEGTWKEVSQQAQDLPEEQPVRLTILTTEETLPARPNEAMLSALREISKIQEGMKPTPSGDTQKLLREARGGGMYGYEPTE